MDLFLSIFLFTIFLGLSSSNFITIWFSMEMNLIVFIPLMSGMKTMQEIESTIKYFLIQSISSSLFLFSCIIVLYLNKPTFLFNTLLIISILTKLGAAPFHTWFPSVLSNIKWSNVFFTAVLQKIMPLFLIMLISMNNFTILFVSLLNVLIGTLSGFTQFCLKKIMAFSSMSHLSWMLVTIKTNIMIFLMYFIFYTMLMMEITIFFNFMSLNYLTDISTKKDSSTISILVSSKMLSLGGLPPFLGFYPKMASTFAMMKESLIWVPLFLMFVGTVSIFIYTRTIFNYLLMVFNSYKVVKGEYSLKKTTWFFLICSETVTLMLSFFMYLLWIF